jgi:predicted nucleic acid-binding protein
VTLEQWDSDRKKWVLYKLPTEHSQDCIRFPLKAMPRRIFLDTNVINLLVKFSEQVFEQTKIPDSLDQTTAEDIEALMHVFYVGSRADWDILASNKVLDEIKQTSDAEFRAELLEYAISLVGSPDEDSAYATSLGRRLVSAPFVSALRDPADRELIGNAVGFGCDVFCTRDRRTITRRREQVTQLPLRILTPVEWWRHVKPWAGLWS